MSTKATPPPKGFKRLDHALVEFARRWGLGILRFCLGVVFIWFGALKVFDVSPVANLLGEVLFFVPQRIGVFASGVVELIIGVGLISGFALRLTLLLFFLQMLGTFAVVIVRPDLVFKNGNPLILTTTGEFILKNLVLTSAGLAVASTVRKAGRDEDLPEMLGQSAAPEPKVQPARDAH